MGRRSEKHHCHCRVGLEVGKCLWRGKEKYSKAEKSNESSLSLFIRLAQIQFIYEIGPNLHEPPGQIITPHPISFDPK